jgi:hypothetical protein
MLRASTGISTRSEAERLKFGLFMALAWLHPAFMKAAAVPREATSAHKSPWPIITLSRTSTSFSTHSSAPGTSSAEKLASSDAAPTELNILFNRVLHWLAKLKHLSLRVFIASLSFMFFSASTLSVTFRASISRLNQLEFSSKTVWASVSSLLNFLFWACASASDPSAEHNNLSFSFRESSSFLILFSKPLAIASFFCLHHLVAFLKLCLVTNHVKMN